MKASSTMPMVFILLRGDTQLASVAYCSHLSIENNNYPQNNNLSKLNKKLSLNYTIDFEHMQQLYQKF